MQKIDSKTSNLFGKIKIVVFLAIAALSLTSTIRAVSSVYSSRNRVNDAEGKLEAEKKRNEELKDELSQVQSEFYKEKQARDKLGFTNEGDIVIVLPDEALLRRLSPRMLEEEDNGEIKPNWEKWYELFFDM